MNLRNLQALGYQQLTSLAAAAGLTVPAGTETILVQCETQNVRMRDDGTDPTAAVGMLLVTNTVYQFSEGQFSVMKFIEAVASAKLNVLYYGKS